MCFGWQILKQLIILMLSYGDINTDLVSFNCQINFKLNL